MTTHTHRRFRRPLVAAAAIALVAATALIVPTGTTAAQGPEEYVFATFDAPVGNTVTGELNGVGFSMESFYRAQNNPDPITVNSCDLSGASYDPAGPSAGQCANTWARADYDVTFDEPVEGLRIYFQGLRGRGNNDSAGGSDFVGILPNELGCEEPVICWEIQSGLDGAEPSLPLDGYLYTAEAELMNGVLFMGPSVPSVSSFLLESAARPTSISLMGVTFAVPAGDPDPTTTTTAPGPTSTTAPGPTSTTAPGPTPTVPAGKPATPRFTG